MNNFSSVINSIKNSILKSAKTCYDSPADFWQRAALFTITAYHLCQVMIIGINKDTPKKEKAFLIPQEIADGIINIATFAVFAQGFKTLGRKLVKKGVIKPFKGEANNFSEEFATTTNLVGSLIAVNIASPIIRNKIAAGVQKKIINEPPNSENKNKFQYFNSRYRNPNIKI